MADLVVGVLEAALAAGRMWHSQRLKREAVWLSGMALLCLCARPFAGDGFTSSGALVVAWALGVLGSGITPSAYVRGISNILSDLYTTYLDYSIASLAGLLLGSCLSKLLPTPPQSPTSSTNKKHKRAKKKKVPWRNVLVRLARVVAKCAGLLASVLVAVRAFGLPSREALVYVTLFHASFHFLEGVLGEKTLCGADAAVLANAVTVVALHVVSIRYANSPGCPLAVFTAKYLVDPGRYLWHSTDATAALLVMFACTALLCVLVAAVAPVFPERRRGVASLLTFGSLCLCVAAAADRWFSALRVKAGLVSWGVGIVFFTNGADDGDQYSQKQHRPLTLAYWAFCLVAGGLLLWVATSIPSSSSELDDFDPMKEINENEENDEDDDDDEKEENKKMGRGWRKFFHFLAVAMFVPIVATDIELFRVASCVAVCGMVAVEGFRALAPRELSAPITRFYGLFAAHQDGGVVILTHISLLVGLALPAWLDGCVPRCHWLAPYSGFVCIGVADSFASLVGAAWGRHKWPGSPKTVEGTAAGVVSAWAFTVVLWLACCGDHSPFPLADPAVHAAIVGSMLVEAFTTQIDNLVLPLHFYMLLNVLPK